MAVIAETKPKISAAEMERRRYAVRYAVSHNRIEGQFMSPQSTAIFEAYVRHSDQAIWLRGLPDMAESRPHSPKFDPAFGLPGPRTRR